MKTVIIFLCAVLIGFGYLLSIHISSQEEIARLQQQVSQLESDKRTLQAQLAQTQQVRDELAQQNQVQAETIGQLEQKIADQQKQIMALQAEVSMIKAGSSIRGPLSNAFRFGIVLPLIPAALATTYLVVRSHKHAPRKTGKATGPRSTWVQLTDREVEKLIQLRRKQYR